MANVDKTNKLEKFYTEGILLDKVWELLNENIDISNITEFLENSAGGGNMIDYLKDKTDIPIIAYDIKNETKRDDIIELDYLKHNIDYKEGRCTFMNPPFTKGLKFFYKAIEESDYVIAILATSSIISFDYEKYGIPKMYNIKGGYKFNNKKMDICIIFYDKNNIINLDDERI